MSLERTWEQHPSYGMLSVSHTQGGDRTLFGSAVKHNNTVMIRLSEGEEERAFHEYKQSPRKLLFEVEMSKAQFADFISSAGYYEGVPCTIRHRADIKEIIPDPPFHDEKEMAANEFKYKNNKVNQTIDTLIDDVQSIFSEKKNITKKDRDTILNVLESIQREVKSNTNFAMDMFVENTEKITTQAKAEIEAFFDNKLRSIANEAIAQKIADGTFSDIHNPIAIEDKKHL